jgi:Flp pilus assembly protein TadG
MSGFEGARRLSFGRSRSGNVAMMWALMAAVLIGLVGVTVDFTRAQMLRTQMQNAADGAALVAERSSSLPMAQRTAAAKAFFDSEMGSTTSGANFTLTQLSTGGHQVDVSMPMPLSLGAVWSSNDWTIRVSSSAQADASPPIEVALVLDNTGSMANDMQSLRDAASDLTASLLSLDGDSVKVALVPFVAQVNIGNQSSHLAWMDQAGQAAYNGELLEDRPIAYRAINTNTHSSNYTGANCEALSTKPYSSYNGPYQITWLRIGTLLSSRCVAFTPPDSVNYLTLFNQIANESWKGCVEARPEPYDVQDDAPNTARPDTMFVPFFWLDTADGYSNSYYTDTIGDITGATMSSSTTGSSTTQEQRVARMFNVFKYNHTNASIDSSAPDTRGPNRGCPTPIVPLTTDNAALQTAIGNMIQWNGGGTNQAEGLAWGWRVLSPGAPFTEGAPYGPDVRKVIVLMSDGENTNVGSDPVLSSDYSAYNHLGLWRDYDQGNWLGQLLGSLLNSILHGAMPAQYQRNISSSSNYVTYVNNREQQVCANIKAAGIEIYTVIFRETDTATVNLMRNCASGSDHFYRADDGSQLKNAFKAIGSGIGQLRLVH